MLDPLPRPPQSYDAAEFATLVDKYEKLNWRIISKPGGATVKPDEFYALYGSVCVCLEREVWFSPGNLKASVLAALALMHHRSS